MTGSELVGLALLPLIFFVSAYLLPARIAMLGFMFNAMAVFSIIFFFAQAMVEIPAMAVPLSYLYYMSIALLILFLFLELLNLIIILVGKMQEGIEQTSRIGKRGGPLGR